MKPIKKKIPLRAKGPGKAGRKTKAGKKAAAAAAAALRQRRRTRAIGGAVALGLVIAWLLFMPAKKEPPPAAPTGTGGTWTGPNRQTPPSAAPASVIPAKSRAFLRAVRLRPSEPTRRDRLRAEVEVAPDAPEGLSYTYLWKVNDRVVEEATGDTLNLAPFKKRDLVTVTVTPHDGDTAGFAVESPVIALYSIPPSLSLKAVRQVRKISKQGEAPLELQLVGVAPDGKVVAFSLEDPRVPGMTIDRHSGKISWHRQPGQKGTFRFGAAVQDDTLTKVTRIFTFTVE